MGGWMRRYMDGWKTLWMGGRRHGIHGFTNARLGLCDTRVGGCVGGWIPRRNARQHQLASMKQTSFIIE